MAPCDTLAQLPVAQAVTTGVFFLVAIEVAAIGVAIWFRAVPLVAIRHPWTFVLQCSLGVVWQLLSLVSNDLLLRRPLDLFTCKATVVMTHLVGTMGFILATVLLKLHSLQALKLTSRMAMCTQFVVAVAIAVPAVGIQAWAYAATGVGFDTVLCPAAPFETCSLRPAFRAALLVVVGASMVAIFGLGSFVAQLHPVVRPSSISRLALWGATIAAFVVGLAMAFVHPRADAAARHSGPLNLVFMATTSVVVAILSLGDIGTELWAALTRCDFTPALQAALALSNAMHKGGLPSVEDAAKGMATAVHSAPKTGMPQGTPVTMVVQSGASDSARREFIQSQILSTEAGMFQLLQLPQVCQDFCRTLLEQPNPVHRAQIKFLAAATKWEAAVRKLVDAEAAADPPSRSAVKALRVRMHALIQAYLSDPVLLDPQVFTFIGFTVAKRRTGVLRPHVVPPPSPPPRGRSSEQTRLLAAVDRDLDDTAAADKAAAMQAADAADVKATGVLDGALPAVAGPAVDPIVGSPMEARAVARVGACYTPEMVIELDCHIMVGNDSDDDSGGLANTADWLPSAFRAVKKRSRDADQPPARWSLSASSHAHREVARFALTKGLEEWRLTHTSLKSLTLSQMLVMLAPVKALVYQYWFKAYWGAFVNRANRGGAFVAAVDVLVAQFDALWSRP